MSAPTPERPIDLSPLKIDRAPDAARRAGGPRGRRPRWVKWVVVLALLAGLGFLFRVPLGNLVDAWTLPEVQTARVQLRSPVAAAAVTGTSSNGYIVAKTRAALSADTPGRIVEMNVEEGSVVKRGDVVARLYSDEYKAALRRAEADLAVAEAAHTRALAESAASQSALDRLRSSEKAAVADVGQYEAQVELAKLEFERAVGLLENKVDTAQRRDQARAALDTANARLEWSKAQLEAARGSVLEGGTQLEVSRAAAGQAQASVEAARAARDLSAATLEKTDVRAPFDGIVVLKDAEVGEVVSPNVQGGSNARGSVVTMVDFASLEVQAEVSETSLAAVRIGANANIYLDAFPEKPYPGRVDRIWPTANRTKATVEVRVAFEERDERLRPEMGVRVVFLDEAAQRAPSDGVVEEATLVVPENALFKSAGADAVFVLERDTVRLRPVTLGGRRAGKAVVREGLVEGETIVLDPPPTLEDGDRVRAKQG